MEKILLIDGNSLVNRAFYALPRLSAGEQPTGAVYGFLTMLLKLMESERPDGVAVAFDTPAPTFRHRQYAAYKAHRTGMPEELAAQLPVLKAILEALGLVTWEVEGCEADDVLGTAACRAAHRGNQVVIVSGDRDILQLVGPHTRVMLTKHRGAQLEEFDEARLTEDYGLSPAQFIELKGLMGDASDNIPGVPGIGEKRAIAILKAFGTIDNALSRIAEVEPKAAREALAAHGEQARLSRQLAAIQCDLPLDQREPRPWQPREEAVVALFTRYQFTSLLPRLGLKPPPAMSITENVPPYSWLEHPEELESFLAGAPGKAVFVYSWPAKGSGGQPGALAVWYGERPVSCLDLRARTAGELGVFQAVLASGLQCSSGLVVHDGKPLASWALRQGAAAARLGFDSMLAAYLLDPTRSSYRLEDTCRDLLGLELPPAPKTAGSRDGPACSRDELGAHLAAGAGALPGLRQALDEQLVAQGMDRLYYEVELPLVEVLAAMESAGIAVDVDRARDMAKEFGGSIGRLAQTIYGLAGVEFNINSTRQLAEVLFGKLQLPTQKRTKTGYSTDAEVLEALAPRYEIAARLLEYRQLVKLKGTYLDGLEQWVDPVTGRLHTTFNQAATATGRLSSVEPNLQNIPVRMELGRAIRRVFVAPAGSVLLAADYSQIELRVLAHLANVPALVDAFARGEDIHARTAAEVFGVPLGAVTKELRNRAKAVNFGIVYGISDYGLAQNLGVSRPEAKMYIDAYLSRYPGVREYMQSMVRLAREEGYVVTLLGRRRPIPDIESRNGALRMAAERTAINTPVQGSAADLIKAAMVWVHQELASRKLQARMLLQVHDELIFEVPEAELAPVARLVRQGMEGVGQLRVPLQADLKAGPSWYDLRPIVLEELGDA